MTTHWESDARVRQPAKLLLLALTSVRPKGTTTDLPHINFQTLA